ncbi:hypothetical protein HAX54_017651 [Datura stramonium]|uniref:Uncharacterized protein n=1 Tax=Datura stramonium TaxID=4076 RepID=A0ABS8UMQ4_DATST|nr:hypothetical protein [Datura stramonium]
MGKTLKFLPPTKRDGKLVVKIDEEDVKEQSEQWKTTLVGYVIGDKPIESLMDNYVTNVWNSVAKPHILVHDEGRDTIDCWYLEQENAWTRKEEGGYQNCNGRRPKWRKVEPKVSKVWVAKLNHPELGDIEPMNVTEEEVPAQMDGITDHDSRPMESGWAHFVLDDCPHNKSMDLENKAPCEAYHPP